MTLKSTSDSSSILKDGKLKPEIYKIQSINTDETYVDVDVLKREVCCRSGKDLGEGRGLWEIKQFGAGYTVRRVEPGKPDQFCTPLKGTSTGTTLRVTPYPVAWNIKIVDDDDHRGFYWGTEKIVWDLAASSRDPNGAPVQTYPEASKPIDKVWQIWRLIPEVKRASPEPGSLTSYEGDAEQPSTRTRHTVFECDELGTVVNEVTVVTTTVTTRKKYQVDDA